MLHGYLPAILAGLQTTIIVALLSLAFACGFGLIGALAKMSDSRLARGLADTYTTVIRGLPDLVLMLIIFYGGQIAMNAIGDRMKWDYVEVSPFTAGTLTLGFIFGAYLTETFRGAILAVPKGQIEAATAFGFRRLDVVRRIMVPQMVRHALPGFTNNWLVMVKATSLISIIGLDDMVSRAGLAASATNQPFTFYAAIAGFYLAITTLSLLLLKWVEHRYSPGVRRSAS